MAKQRASHMRMYFFSLMLFNGTMKTIDEIHRANMALLVAEHGVTGMAERLNKSNSQVSQWLNGSKNSGTGKPRGISAGSCRTIEAAFGKPQGWMDADHGDISGHGASVDQGYPIDQDDPVDGPADVPFLAGVSRVRVGQPTVEMTAIKLVTMHLQAGIMGFEVQQDFDDGGTLDVPSRWIEEGDFVPHCLMAIKVRGDSMQPLLYLGYFGVFNIADTKKISGGVYAINFNGEPVVKRLRYERNEWYMTSENTLHPRRLCKGGACIIVGRIVRFEARNFKDRL
jgi:hypothetical protein